MTKIFKKISLILFSLFTIAACSSSSNSSSNNPTVEDNVVYTVAFDGNGAESGSINSIQAVNGQQISLPDNEFVKDGYRFTGWAESAQGQVKYLNQSYITVTSDIVLYAVWEKIESVVTTYTIILSSGYDNTFYSYTVEFDKPFQLPDNLFQRNGYIFTGWSINKDGEIIIKIMKKLLLIMILHYMQYGSQKVL